MEGIVKALKERLIKLLILQTDYNRCTYNIQKLILYWPQIVKGIGLKMNNTMRDRYFQEDFKDQYQYK